MKSSAKPSDILAKVNEMAGFGPDEEVDLYEVRLSLSSLLFLKKMQSFDVDLIRFRPLEGSLVNKYLLMHLASIHMFDI